MVSGDEQDEHGGDGRPLTGQDVTVTSARGGIASFTPEQVTAARGYADAARGASTRAKYLQHWTAFGAWCREYGQRALPADPAVVAVHLSSLAAKVAPQTLALRMAAVGQVLLQTLNRDVRGAEEWRVQAATSKSPAMKAFAPACLDRQRCEPAPS